MTTFAIESSSFCKNDQLFKGMNQNQLAFNQYGDAQLWASSMRVLMEAECVQFGKGSFLAASAVVSSRNLVYSISKCAKTCAMSFRPVEGSVLICILRAGDQLQTNLGSVEAGGALAFVLDQESVFFGRLPQDTEMVFLKLTKDRFTKMIQSWFGFVSNSQVDRLLMRGVQVDASLVDNCMLASPSWNESSSELQDCPGSFPANSPVEASLLLAFFAALVPLAEGEGHTEEMQHLAMLDKAVQLMLTNYSEKITLNQLCKACGASSSTLINAFTRFWRISPMKFLLKVRLQKAHTLLSLFTAMHSVTSVATEAGFWHYGRFSGYYRLQFLELPSETLWRLSASNLTGHSQAVQNNTP
jgi:AraC-like DNA-binding protein